MAGPGERDLQAARNELSVAVPLPEISAYHAQQAVEKALKGFLTARSTPFPQTHDLVRLIGLCEAIDPAFAPYLATGETLNPYATLFRYPGGPLVPPTEEAEAAVQLADRLIRCVRQNL